MDAMLKSIPLFTGLADEEYKLLARIAVKKSFPKNAVIIHAEDLTDSLYVIHTGRVKVSLFGAQGKELILSVLDVGEFFGEMALIDEAPRSASVTAVEPCQLSVITKDNFRRCLADHPSLAINLMRGLTHRLRAANQKIGSLALMDVYGRVARTLLQYAKPTDGPTKGAMVIDRKLTQKEIAHMVGASREMVSRIFKTLIVGKYICIENKRIVINQRLPQAW